MSGVAGGPVEPARSGASSTLATSTSNALVCKCRNPELCLSSCISACPQVPQPVATESPRREMVVCRTSLHFLAALHFWFSCYYDWNYVVVPEGVHRIGVTLGRTNKLKFLTYWDALLQATFFTVCFVNDLLGNNDETQDTKRMPRLRKLQDMMMSCLAFPISMFVGLTFWGLYAVDRELVLPKAIDPYFPCWLNHCMHTNIMIFVLIEMVKRERTYPRRRVGLAVLASFMLLYLAWVHVIFSYTGVWVYPVLDVLGLPMRLVFFGSLLSLAVVLYCAGEKLNERVWGRRTPQAGLDKTK